MTSTKRLQKELVELEQQPLEHVSISVNESNILRWDCLIQGPPSSAYKGGSFKLLVEFPAEYPFKSPKIKFQTRIYHPNVDDDGSICLGILKTENWKPSTKMSSVLSALVDLLQTPNPDDALRSDIAQLYKTNYQEFSSNCLEWIKKYC